MGVVPLLPLFAHFSTLILAAGPNGGDWSLKRSARRVSRANDAIAVIEDYKLKGHNCERAVLGQVATWPSHSCLQTVNELAKNSTNCYNSLYSLAVVHSMSMAADQWDPWCKCATRPPL